MNGNGKNIHHRPHHTLSRRVEPTEEEKRKVSYGETLPDEEMPYHSTRGLGCGGQGGWVESIRINYDRKLFRVERGEI